MIIKIRFDVKFPFVKIHQEHPVLLVDVPTMTSNVGANHMLWWMTNDNERATVVLSHSCTEKQQHTKNTNTQKLKNTPNARPFVKNMDRYTLFNFLRL